MGRGHQPRGLDAPGGCARARAGGAGHDRRGERDPRRSSASRRSTPWFSRAATRTCASRARTSSACWSRRALPRSAIAAAGRRCWPARSSGVRRLVRRGRHDLGPPAHRGLAGGRHAGGAPRELPERLHLPPATGREHRPARVPLPGLPEPHPSARQHPARVLRRAGRAVPGVRRGHPLAVPAGRGAGGRARPAGPVAARPDLGRAARLPALSGHGGVRVHGPRDAADPGSDHAAGRDWRLHPRAGGPRPRERRRGDRGARVRPVRDGRGPSRPRRPPSTARTKSIRRSGGGSTSTGRRRGGRW